MAKVFLTATFFAILAVLYFYVNRETLIKTPSELNPQYDYIVVGGGSAGAILASRLSEVPSRSVLLIEAGPAEYVPWYHDIPGAAPFLQQTIVDWQYVTEPQNDVSRATENQRSLWPRGKKLGGSSSLNYMLWNRGDPSEYDRWASFDGCSGWAYNQVEHILKAMETCNFDVNKAHRGKSGPFQIHLTTNYSPYAEQFLVQADKLGYKTRVDYNAPGNHQSYAKSQGNIDNKGRRQDTGNVMLRSAMKRPNLHVITEAHVKKILFDRSSTIPKTTGVEYVWSDGKTYRVLTNKEVFISGGAINSPQLLMLSGIGHRDHLKEHNIPLVVHSPFVGANLRDHLFLALQMSTNDTNAHFGQDQMGNPWKALPAIIEYLLYGTGFFAANGAHLIGHQTTGLLPSEYQSDVQSYVINYDLFDRFKNAWIVNWKKAVVQHGDATYSDAGPERSMISGPVVLHHPRSKGYVKLQSADFRQHPIIQPNYLKDKLDIAVFVKGVRSYLNIVRGITKYDLRVHNKCADKTLKVDSDAWIECIIRDFSLTLYHPMGTAKMGKSLTDSVVDNKLRVHGVSGLRVADVSVLPDTFGANTNIPAMLIGWRAADLID